MNTENVYEILDNEIRLKYNSRAEFGRKVGMTRQGVKVFMDILKNNNSGNSFNKISRVLEKAGYKIEIIFFIKSNNSSIFLSLFSITITPFVKDVIILIMIELQFKRKVRRCEMKRFFKLGLLFSIGILLYLKELIAALLILKLTNFETALIFSISLLASTINLKHNKNLFSFVGRIVNEK